MDAESLAAECTVRKNCHHAYCCDFCQPGYRDYQPINVHILSPAQLERREGRKASAKEKKKSEASKRGKRNRQSGKRAEKELFDWMEKQGFDVRRVALSGALAGKNLVGGAKSYDGDLHWNIFDEEHIIESKYGMQAEFIYKNTSGLLPCFIGEYAAAFDVYDLFMWLSGKEAILNMVPDTNKALHTFFEQDNSDVVVCKLPNKERIFLVKKEVYDRWSSMIQSIKKSGKNLPICGIMTRKRDSALRGIPSRPVRTTKKSAPSSKSMPKKESTKPPNSQPTSPLPRVRRMSRKETDSPKQTPDYKALEKCRVR